MPSVGIIGMGAIGGWIAGALADAGVPVRCLARGATLETVLRDGLTVEQGGRRMVVDVQVSDEAQTFGPQDILVLAVKANALAGAARAAASMIGPQTIIVPMVNGVPWWFMTGTGHPPLQAVDPDGAIGRMLPADQVVGCVVHASCSLAAPAHIIVNAADTLVIGAATPDAQELVTPVRELLRSAGLPVRVASSIRTEVWYKLWGNMTVNPISALTRSTTDRILDDPLLASFALSVMAEAALVGERIGCAIEESGEQRQTVTRRLGAFKTSMLQDIEAGRQMETAALLEAPRELAQRLGIATPALDALLGLSRLLAAEMLATRQC